jgi:methylenetetrahydrofolate reductase (NADPH)
MRIDELLQAERDRPLFSFEFFPPKTDEGERNLLAALEELRELGPDYVSVTYGAGGTTREKTIELVSRIQEDFGLDAMAHFTCVNATVDELRATLARMRDAGIDNVLALRGDPPQGEERWTKTEGGLEFSRELVELIRDEFPEFAIGAAAFPETHIHASSPDDDLRYTAQKVEAGAGFLVTQLFFDNAVYFDFVERARALGVTAPIIPGVLPITGYAQLARITSLCGATLPEHVLGELEARKDDPDAVAAFGVAYATMQCADLLAHGAPGIHFYTLNRSPATRAILSTLKLWRPCAPRRPPAPA